MVYTLGFPTVGQSLGNSRADVLNNWQALYDGIAQNHIPLNAAGQGKHQSMQIVLGNPPTTAANEIGLFSNTVSSVMRLVMRQASDGSTIVLSGDNPTLGATSFSTFLPGLFRVEGASATGSQGTISFGPYSQTPWLGAAIVSNRTDQRTIQFSSLTTTGANWRILDKDENAVSGTFTVLIIGKI